METANHLDCPELACYRVSTRDDMRMITYAVRGPGDVHWAGFAILTVAGEPVGSVETDATALDPVTAERAARQHLLRRVLHALLDDQEENHDATL